MPAIFQFFVSLFAPESPRWLIYKDRPDEAFDMLDKYYANGDRTSALVRFEFLEIQATLDEEKRKYSLDTLLVVSVVGVDWYKLVPKDGSWPPAPV